jgi:dolichyl-phosphate beta-glucosyltransferase
MDADLATPLQHLPQFYKACEDGYDIVVGTRNLLKHRPHLLQRAISTAGNILFRVVSGIWIEDTQCGFKMFAKEAARVCFSKMSIQGWGFDMEILTIAKVNGLKWKCIRINDWKDMPDSTFTDNTISNSFRSLKELCYIVISRLKGKY